MKKKLLSILLSVAVLSTSALSLLTGASAATISETAATDAQRLDTVGTDGEMSFDLLESVESYAAVRNAFGTGGFSGSDANNLQYASSGKATYVIDTTTSALDGTTATEGYASKQSLKATSYDSGVTYGFFRWNGFSSNSDYFNGLDEQLEAGNYDDVEVYLTFWAKGEYDGQEITVGMYIKTDMFQETVTLSTEWQEYKINMKEAVVEEDGASSEDLVGLNFMQITAQGLWKNGLQESYVQGLRFRQNDDIGISFWLDEIGIEYSGFEIDESLTTPDDDENYGTAGEAITGDSSDDTSSEEVTSSEDTSSDDTTSTDATTSEDTTSEDTSSETSSARSNEEIAADLATDIYSLSGDNWMIDNFSSYTSYDDLYAAYFNWYYYTNGGLDASIYGGCQIINDKSSYYTVTNGVETAKSQSNISNITTTLSDGAVNLSWGTIASNDTWVQTWNYPCMRWRVNQAFLGNDGSAYSLIGDGWAVDVTTDVDLRLAMKIHVDGNSRVYTYEVNIAAGFSGTIACPYSSLSVGGVEIGTDGVEDMKAWVDKKISSGEAIVLSIGFYEDSTLTANGSCTWDNVRFYTTDSAYTTQVANARAAAAAADLSNASEEQIALYNAAMAQVDAEYAALGGYATPAQYEAIAYKYAYAAEYVGATVTVDTVTSTGSNGTSGSGSNSGSSSSTSPSTGTGSHVAVASILLIAAGSVAIILGKRKEEIGE